MSTVKCHHVRQYMPARSPVGGSNAALASTAGLPLHHGKMLIVALFVNT